MSRTLHAVAKSPEEIDRALTVLAYYGGNAERAAAELGNIAARTLRSWRSQTHRDRYLQIAEREGPRIEALAAANARELVIRAADVEHDLLDRMADQPINPDTGQATALTTKELSELAGAFQRIATAKGINTTKLLELTGRPTSIVEHRDPKQEGLALLRDLGITLNATATDMTDVPLLPGKASANARAAAQAKSAASNAAD